MRVKELAEVAGTTVRTIRYYHQLGVLAVPERGASWRSYGFAHLTRLMRIRWLVESGVPLAEVPHLLGDHTDERGAVTEDLRAVRASIDAKIATLRDQRSRVDALLGRARSEGRLTPLPPAMVAFYDALLRRPMDADLVSAVERERDLIELVCYRGDLPAEVLTLVEAQSAETLEDFCVLWEEMVALGARSGSTLTADVRHQVEQGVRRTVALADRCDPAATAALLARIEVLDRPVVQAAFGLAFPSPVMREFLVGLSRLARERSAA